MIGEPQILGQVKDAFALAQACETVGPHLHTLFSQAFSVAKRVRTETEIAPARGVGLVRRRASWPRRSSPA